MRFYLSKRRRSAQLVIERRYRLEEYHMAGKLLTRVILSTSGSSPVTQYDDGQAAVTRAEQH